MRFKTGLGLLCIMAALGVDGALVTSTFTSVNAVGVTVTRVSVFDPATQDPAAAAAAAATTTTTPVAAVVPPAAATTTSSSDLLSETTTPVVPPPAAVGAESATTTPVTTPRVPTTSAQANALEPATGTRPDPARSRTPLYTGTSEIPPIDSYVTLVFGTTSTTTSKRKPTDDQFVTITVSGRLTTQQTTFRQRFSSQYTELATPKSGGVGLGTISGSVGIVRQRSLSTVSAKNDAAAFYAATFSFTSMFLTALMMLL